MSANFFIGNTQVDIALTDELGNAVLVKCTTANIPNGAAHYAEGCDLIASDTGNHYYNQGNATSANFVMVEAGSNNSITSLTGDVAATGPGAVPSIINKIKGLIVNASMGSAFTGALIQYTGNVNKGWINTSLLTGTAASNAVTMVGEGGCYEITTESLTLIPGATYTLAITGLILTGSTNAITDITYGTATAGLCKVVKKVKSGGAITFTIKNVSATETCNGTFIINMLAF